MADSYWVDASGNFLVDGSGDFYFCPTCPCLGSAVNQYSDWAATPEYTSPTPVAVTNLSGA